MDDVSDAIKKRGLFVDDAIYLALGKLLCERATDTDGPLKITVAELADKAGLSRPSIYKRTDVTIAIERLAHTADLLARPADKAALKQLRSDHASELVKIASEKMSLMARIHNLEEKLKRYVN
jgi:AcrR family transcriptional regulator